LRSGRERLNKGKHSLRVKLALRAVDRAGNPTTESRFITLRR
jgi:hypothetical protein